MDRPSKIIRIFVCSTFKEFERERNQLAKEVFPELETLCRSAGMVFQVVDLRWGVSKQDSANHQTIPICLSEIRKCQEQSPGLNFLVMVGSDYGSVLAPAEIPADDWKLLMSKGGLDAEAQSLLKTYYRRDFNAPEAPYCLPRSDGERNIPERWIQVVLSGAAERALPEGTRRNRFTASVTELEMNQGLFSGDARRGAIVAIRQPLRKLPASAFRSPEKQTKLRRHVLEFMLKEAIVCDEGDASFVPEIGERLKEAVKRRIQEAQEAEKTVSPLEMEEETVREELQRTAETYLDMTVDIDAFSRFAAEHRGKAVLVTGEQGVGKTTFLKTWAHRNGAVCVFEDIQPSRATMGQALGYLAAQLRRCGILPTSMQDYFKRRIARLLGRKIPPETVDERVENLSLKQFENLLRFAIPPDKHSFTIIIDSKKLFEDSSIQDYYMGDYYRGDNYRGDYRGNLFRISLPPWLTLVVSCVSLTWEERRDIPKFRMRPFHNVVSAEEPLWKLLDGKGRYLTGGQRRFIRSVLPERTTPLYLNVLADFLRTLESYAPLPGKLSNLPDSSAGIGEFLLRQNEYSPAPTLYWNTLGYLALSADGLNETEILDLSRRDGQVWGELLPKRKSDWDREKYIINVHWARMRNLLDGVLLEHKERGVSLLRFRHDLIQKAALRLVAQQGTGDTLRTLARNLRHYFSGQDIYLHAGGNVLVNYRRVRELYPVLDFLGEYDGAARMFSDPRCIDAYIRAGEYRRLRAELDALADRNANLDALSDILALMSDNDLLLQDCPDSFLSVYVQAHPEEAAHLLPQVGQSVWLEVSYPDTLPDDKHMYIPYASISAAALGENGVIAMLLGNRVRVFDWNTRLYTGVEYRLEITENSSAFLYWEKDTLIVRFEKSRLSLRYTETELRLEKREECPELPLMDADDRDEVEEAGGLRECEERGYASERIFPYRVNQEVRHAELFYPMEIPLRVYRHENLAAVLLENNGVEIIDLAKNCLLLRLEIVSAAYARFSPDGRRVLVCREDNAIFYSDVPAEGKTPLPTPGMSLRKYARKYNAALVRESWNLLTLLFTPASYGELPFTSAPRNAFLGDTAPLFACMSKEHDWLACYYYYHNAAFVRRYRLSTLELLNECRVPPIFVQDAQAGDPFRALDGGGGLALTSGGVTHIWRFRDGNETGKWTHQKRTSVPRTERTEYLAHLPILPYALLCLLLPEAWRRHIRFLRGELAPVAFPPIRLPDGDYLWEVDRNTRRVSLLTKDGKPLCRVQLRHAILTASARNGELLIPLENSAGEIVIRIRYI